MFTLLFSVFQGFFDWIRYAITDIWKQCSLWFTKYWGAIVLVGGWIWFALQYCNELLDKALNNVGLIGIPSLDQHGALGNLLQVANTFWPLDYAIDRFGAWLSLVGGILLFKIGKRIWI